MKDKTKKKRDREQRVVEEMILLYCRAHHHDAPCAPLSGADRLCQDAYS